MHANTKPRTLDALNVGEKESFQGYIFAWAQTKTLKIYTHENVIHATHIWIWGRRMPRWKYRHRQEVCEWFQAYTNHLNTHKNHHVIHTNTMHTNTYTQASIRKGILSRLRRTMNNCSIARTGCALTASRWWCDSWTLRTLTICTRIYLLACTHITREICLNWLY